MEKSKPAVDVGGEKIEKQKTLRQQIRDTSRLLSREHLPETVRQTKERVLKSLQQELNEKLDEKRERKIARKYKMVKFFEKRKVSRKLKMKMKLCDSYAPEDRHRVQIDEDILNLRMELNYIAHFPTGSKYIALYPSSETTSAKSVSRKEKIMAEISEQVASGELPDVSLESTLSDRPVVDSKKLPNEHVREISKLRRNKKCLMPKVVKIKSRTRLKIEKAPVDEEPDFEDDLGTKKGFSYDDFFIDTNGNFCT